MSLFHQGWQSYVIVRSVILSSVSRITHKRLNVQRMSTKHGRHGHWARGEDPLEMINF